MAGLKFVVHVRLRRDDPTSPYGLHDPFGQHDSLGRERQQDDLLRLGVLFADGRRTVNESGWRSERDYSESGEPLLRAEGSGGSSRYWDGDKRDPGRARRLRHPRRRRPGRRSVARRSE